MLNIIPCSKSKNIIYYTVILLILIGIFVSCSATPKQTSVKTGEDYCLAVWQAFWENASDFFGVEYSDYKMTHTSYSFISDNHTSDGYVSHYYLIQTAFEKKNALGQNVIHKVTARCYYVPSYDSSRIYTVYITLDGNVVYFDEETENWLLGIGAGSPSNNSNSNVAPTQKETEKNSANNENLEITSDFLEKEEITIDNNDFRETTIDFEETPPNIYLSNELEWDNFWNTYNNFVSNNTDGLGYILDYKTPQKNDNYYMVYYELGENEYLDIELNHNKTIFRFEYSYSATTSSSQAANKWFTISALVWATIAETEADSTMTHKETKMYEILGQLGIVQASTEVKNAYQNGEILFFEDETNEILYTRWLDLDSLTSHFGVTIYCE